MTTKVLIVNFGPDHVLVRTFTKDNEPGDSSFNCPTADYVAPGNGKEFYVHSNQGLIVDEERKPVKP